MLVLHEPGLVDRLEDVVHRRGRHARLAERLQPLRGRPRAERALEDRHQLVAVAGRARAKSAKRGSVASSGRPIASQRRTQNFSFGAATTIQPSAVWKFWNGTIDGCAEFARRGGT